MTALFLIPLCATSLGGAIALGALFHRSNVRTDVEISSDADSAATLETFSDERNAAAELLDEIARRERALAAFNAELDAKQAALETLTRRASEAAATLGRVLDSFSTTFGESNGRSAAPRPTSRANSAFSATTFEPFRALDVELRTELGADSNEYAFRR